MHQTNTKTATQDSIQQVTGDEIWPWAWRSRGPGGRSCSVVWYWRTVYHSTLCQMEGWRTVCVRGGWGLSQCWPPYGCGVWCKCLRWRGEWLRWWFQPSSPLAAGSCGPQPSQEVETLLGFLHDGGGVEGPGNVLHQVDTEELYVLHDLHRGAVDDQWLVVPLSSPEVNKHLFGFVYIQGQVVTLHQVISCSTSSLCDDSPSFESCSAVQSWVRSVNSSGLSTQPWGGPVRTVVVLEVLLPIGLS